MQTKTNELYIGRIGWKYYHKIKKKAMEQEFSRSGLVVNLSIAFFIVVITALVLSWIYVNFLYIF